ncbi:MAG: hypothetical protein DRG20_00200 [Deltaproteobacteria bacterium]|nr:hypothetical protein [Deltaproteobacteria bacterium]RLA91834.1 MAG: hypothetical protein DRG20_00200 [Deltaproteobacteria bacterium]
MDKDKLKEEEKKIRFMRTLIDFSMAVIAQTDIKEDEALKIISSIKDTICAMFPGKDYLFDMIYLPRYRRLLNDKFRRH